MEIAFGKVRVDCKALRGKRGKKAIELTPRELKVLAVLFRERGNAVSREALLNEVWGIEYYGTTRTLDQLIVKLRQKIEDVPGEPRHLLTVHTLGLSAGGLSDRCSPGTEKLVPIQPNPITETSMITISAFVLLHK